MINFQQGSISGKTFQVLDEMMESIRKNPKQVVFTNSQSIKDMIVSLVPDADVRVCEKPE
jgi:peroxiredoxin